MFLAFLTPILIAPPAAGTRNVPDDEAAWAPHRELRVLYAGPGGSRERAFEELLSRWFDEYGAIPLGDLTEEAAAPYDVVIADWMSQYGNDGYPEPDGVHSVPRQLDHDFTRPVVAMNYVASGLRPDHKLDWL